MSRTILDCRCEEIKDLTEKQKSRIDKTCDKLNIPKNGSVMVNLGVRETTTEE